MQKVYYDSVNSKEVVDVTGVKVEADVIAEFGLDGSCQCVEVDIDNGEAHEVVGGTLQVFDLTARSAQAATDAETARQAAEDTTKANLGLDQAGYDALIASMK